MNEAKELNTEESCRLVYADIINGYSYVAEDGIFLKHHTELDIAKIEERRAFFLREAELQGLLSEKDKLALLAVNGHWTKEEEQEYQTLLEELEGMVNSLKKLVIPQQQEHMQNLIKDKSQEMRKKEDSRKRLVSTTKETYANQRVSEFYILSSFYKNKECSQQCFPNEVADEISIEEIQKYSNFYSRAYEVFTEKNFKRIAVCPFFLNSYLVCDDNPFFFFGKYVIDLTIFQLALFNKGSYYKNILEDPSVQRPPDELYKDLSQVVRHYDRQYSIILGKRNNNQLIR